MLRHSTGRTCVITVEVGTELRLGVEDDGTPPTDWRPGVGLRTIVKRAEELGGTAVAGPYGAGWRVQA